MADVLEVDPYANGQFILAFDGRILEIFGKITSRIDMHPTTTDSWSIHVKQLNVKVTGPDKKGLREVRFLTPASPNDGVCALKLDDTDWSRFEPLIDAIAKATGTAAPGSTSDGLLATKMSALQALLSEHGVRLGSQPEDVRNAVVSDLQAAGVPIDSKSLALAPTDPGQLDAMLEVYQRHGLLPSDASLG